ncbi:MAG: translocation/assembly module TamB domain-containing protein [Akkermansiaceae bacterium]
MSETEAEAKQVKKRKGGCLRLFGRLVLVTLFLIIGLLFWLNGPGMRWLGPKVASHYLDKAGFSGGLRLGGSLTGGIEIYDLDIRSEKGSLERLVIDRFETDYRFTEIIKGKLRGLSGEGVQLDIRLVEKEEEEDKPPVDFAELAKTLSDLRGLIIPVEMDLEEVSVSVEKDEKLLFGLGGSSLKHATGSGLIKLDLGRVTGPGGRTLQPQNTKIFWNEESLSLNQIDLLPIAGVRELEVSLPKNGAIAASGQVRLSDAVFNLNVSPEIEDIRLDLVEGGLDFSKLQPGFGLEVPITGKLTSLALEVRQVYPKWNLVEGSIEIFLEDFYYEDWGGPELALGMTINEGDAALKVTGQSLGSQFSIEGGFEFERETIGTEELEIDKVGGDLSVAAVGSVLRDLDAQLDLGERFKAFPTSDLSGSWSLDLKGGMFVGVNADLALKATEVEASPIRIDATYAGNVVTVRTLETENQSASGSFDTATQGYKFKESLSDFTTDSLTPWLNGVGLELPGSATLTMELEGSGNLLAKEHKGSLKKLAGVWKQKAKEGADDPEPISFGAVADYDWPQRVELKQLVAETVGQKVELEAVVEDDSATLRKLNWSDEDGVIASGRGELPLPKDFSKIREFLANDERSLDLKIESELLPIKKLEPWVGGLDKLSETASGKIHIQVAGSLASPEVDADFELRGIGMRDNAKVPSMDITLNLDAGSGVAKVTGQAVAKDYGPAKLEAEMPFLPKKWAAEPEMLKDTALKAALILPQVNLTRFKPMVPGAKTLEGIAEGSVTVGGTIGTPRLDGALSLTGGKLELGRNGVPDLNGIGLELKADLDEVSFNGGIKNLEGGDLDFNGKIALRETAEKKFGDLEFNLKGRGLPVVRNDSMIIRANADLQLKGGIEKAALTGEIGIIDSMFYKDMELIPVGKPFLEPSPAKLPAVKTNHDIKSMVPSPFSSWTSDIVVKTIDPLRIRGNLGTGEVDVALRVGGEFGNPKPNGTVRLRDGVAALPFTTVEIKEGLLKFSPETGLDPTITLSATANARPYRIRVNAFGTMSSPRLALTSQPPMPENEIMTLLATGVTTSRLEDTDGASAQVMQLLVEETRKGRFLFGKQLRPVLELFDNVDFNLSESDPYDSATYNSATLKLTDKWFVSAGVDSDGNQRTVVTYKLRFR